MQVNPWELDALCQYYFLAIKKQSVLKNDDILLFLRIISFVPNFMEKSGVSILSGNLDVHFDITFGCCIIDASDLCQQFRCNSGRIFWKRTLTKASVTSSNNSQSSISSKSFVLLKIFRYSNISHSCGLAFVLPTAAANFDRAERSFNFSTKKYGSKVVLILATCA